MKRIPWKLAAPVAVAAAFLPFGAAQAQTMGTPTGAEIIGQTMTVESGGVTNTVTFNPGGSAQIVDAAGQQVAGNWFVQGGNLCVSAGMGRECFPYQAPFQAGQPVAVTSDCGSAARLTAAAVNPMEAPTPARAGERG